MDDLVRIGTLLSGFGLHAGLNRRSLRPDLKDRRRSATASLSEDTLETSMSARQIG